MQLSSLPDSLLSYIFRGCILKCRMVNKYFKKVVHSSGSVDSPVYLRISEPRKALAVVGNLKFLGQFTNLSVLICSEDFDHEKICSINALGGVSGLKIIQEVTISEIENAAQDSCQSIVSIAQKLTHQKFPLPVNEVLNRILVRLDESFESFDENEADWSFEPVYNFAIRIMFHQALNDDLLARSIELIKLCASYTDDLDAGVHTAVPRSGVISYLAALMRNDKSEVQRQRAGEALIMFTKVPSDPIGVCLISNIAWEGLFQMICSGDSLQVKQVIEVLQDLAGYGIGCRNSLIKVGAIMPLMTLLQTGAKVCQKQVVYILKLLTNCDDELKAVLASKGLGAVLVGLAGAPANQDEAIRRLACQGLLNLIAGGLTAVSALLEEGVADLAVDMAWCPPGSEDRKTGNQMLLHISRSPGVGCKLVAAGVLEAMVAVARSGQRSPWICSCSTSFSSACTGYCSNSRWNVHQCAAFEVLTRLAVSTGCPDISLRLVSAGAVSVFLRASTADTALDHEEQVRHNAIIALYALGRDHTEQCLQSVLAICNTRFRRKCNLENVDADIATKMADLAVLKCDLFFSEQIEDCMRCIAVVKSLFLVAESNSKSGSLKPLAATLAASFADAVARLLGGLDCLSITTGSWAQTFAASTHRTTLAALQAPANGSAPAVVRTVLRLVTSDSAAEQDFAISILSMFADARDAKGQTHNGWGALLQGPDALPGLLSTARLGDAERRLPALRALVLLATASDSAAAALLVAGGRDVLSTCDFAARLWSGRPLRLGPVQAGRTRPEPPRRSEPKPVRAAVLVARRGFGLEQALGECAKGDSDTERDDSDPAGRAARLEGLAAAIRRGVRVGEEQGETGGGGGGGGGGLADRVLGLLGRQIAQELARGPAASNQVLYATLDVGRALFSGVRGVALRTSPAAVGEMLSSLVRLLAAFSSEAESLDGAGPWAALAPLGLGALELAGEVLFGADPAAVVVALLHRLSRGGGGEAEERAFRACMGEMCRRAGPLAATGALRVGPVLREVHRLVQAPCPGPGDARAEDRRRAAGQWGLRLLSALAKTLGESLRGHLPRRCRKGGGASLLRDHLERLLGAPPAAARDGRPAAGSAPS